MKYIILSRLFVEKRKAIKKGDFLLARRFDMAMIRLKNLP